MSVEELKASCYDVLVGIERNQKYLQLLNQEIASRSEVEKFEEKKEVKEKK